MAGQMTAQMRQCIDACNEAHSVCEQTMVLALQKGGALAQRDMMITMMDCADMCRMCSDMTMRQSEMARGMCQMCAEMCRMCADMCERFDEPFMRACMEACRKCADMCQQMASAR
ncbi:four-helix bundle copper-binding protein [Streptomyces sannanensis]